MASQSDVSGGPGSATPIENGLVISNSSEVHEGINKLLGQIDRMYQRRESSTHSRY